MELLLTAMLCIAVIVTGALVALVVILLKPKKNQTGTVRNASAENTRPPHKDWKSWFPFVVIAFLLTIWSMWIALLFLIVTWIMRLDPAPDSNYTLDENQKKTAKRVYAWLFWSSIITYPFFLMVRNTIDWSGSSTNLGIISALAPLIFHIPLLAGLTSKNVFVYRHTQQGILLIALRAGMMSLAVSLGANGWWLVPFGNGSLWFFGSLWGRNQVIRCECWWMRRKGETIILPETRPVEQPAITTEPKQPTTPATKKNKVTIEQSLHTFRTGTPEERKQAVLTLSQLGEVEPF